MKLIFDFWNIKVPYMNRQSQYTTNLKIMIFSCYSQFKQVKKTTYDIYQTVMKHLMNTEKIYTAQEWVIEIEQHLKIESTEFKLNFSRSKFKTNFYFSYSDDNGIFISNIKEKGAAARLADTNEMPFLRNGDKLVAINGHSLLDIEHSVSLNLYLRIDVKLCFRKPWAILWTLVKL